MKIALFSDRPENFAGTRSRVTKFAELLRADGHRCTVCLPFRHGLRERLYDDRSKSSKLVYLALVFLLRIWQLRHVPGADVVFFRGLLFPYGPPFFERCARLMNPRIVVDLDDAIWEPAAYVESPFARFVDYGWTRKVCAFAAHIVAGNPYIADYARTFNANVSIIPTCVDMDTHTVKAQREDGGGPVVLGWTGLSTNLGYLEVIEAVLRELAADHDITLTIASNRDYHLDGVAVNNRRWVLEYAIDYLQEPDIGLMPLTDSERAKGKCAYKALEFMSVGTPCVISPVGMNAEVIADGVSGFLAATPEEWKAKLERLIVDPDLRRRMGEAARTTVRERYSHEVHYPAFKQVMETVAGRSGAEAS